MLVRKPLSWREFMRLFWACVVSFSLGLMVGLYGPVMVEHNINPPHTAGGNGR